MRRLTRALLITFVLFATLTTLWPCRFSYPSVKWTITHSFPLSTLYAQDTCEGEGGTQCNADQPPCGCNRGSINGISHGACQDCNYTANGSMFGCGPLWAFNCDGYGANIGMFF